MAVRSPPVRSLLSTVAIRMAVGLVLLALLIVVFWDFGTTKFDFQAFRAADSLARNGSNPYSGSALDAELSANPETYGDLWATDTTGNYRLFFFNPPAWLAQLRLVGFSALAMSVVGGVLSVAALVGLSIRRPVLDVAAYGAAAFTFIAIGPGATTLEFGQTGLLLSGLVGAYLLLIGSRCEGLPIAMISFKPHLALAIGLPRLIRSPIASVTRIAVPLGALVALTLILYDATLWPSWIEGLTSGERTVVYNDLTLRTLSPRYPLPAWATWPLLAASIAGSIALVRRYHRADVRLLACSTLALSAFASGHAFSHDYLWLIFVPVVCRWTMTTTMAVALVAASPWWSNTSRVLDDWLELQSLVALVASGYLLLAVRESHVRAGRDSADGVLGGEAAVDSEDRAGSEDRLGAR